MRCRLAKLVRRLLGSLALLTLIAVAAVVTAGRYLMPQIGQFQQQIIEEIRAHVDLDFEVESLEGEWRGLSPVVRLKNFRLLSPAGEAVVEASHLTVDVDLLGTLLWRTPMARAVSLVSAEVQLAQDADQRVALAGLPPHGDPGRQTRRWDRFLRQIGLLELSDVRIVLRLPDASQQIIDSLDLVMRQGLYLYQLEASVTEAKTDSALRLSAEFSGWLDDPKLFRCHVALDNYDPAVLRALLGARVEQLPRSIQGQGWVDWERDEGWSLSGDIRASTWSLGPVLDRQLPVVDSVAFRFFVEGAGARPMAGRIEHGYLRWAGSDYRLDEAHFSLGDDGLDVSASEIDLAKLHEAGRVSGLLPDRLERELAVLRPGGWLRDVHVHLPLQRQQLGALRVRARLVDAATGPWRGVPGLDSVDGYVEAGLDGGFVDLDGSALRLEFPGLFREPFEFGALDARVAWELGEHLTVKTGIIAASGDFGSGRGHLKLDVPLRPAAGERPILSLVIGARNVSALYRARFLPLVLSQGLRDWLESSIVSADIDRLGFIYFGALGGEPLDKTVQLFLDVRNGRLRYQPRWPLLANIDAQVVLSNRTLVARSDSARILNSAVSSLQVELAGEEHPDRIEIRGELQGPGRDLMQFLNDTPLQDFTGGALRDWRAGGRYTAGLDLKVPLRPGAAPELVVKGQLNGVALANRKLDIEFTDIRGDLRYTSWRGLAARRLRGKLWGQPMQASVRSHSGGIEGGAATVLEASAPVAVDRLGQWLDVPASALASGATEVAGTLTMRPPGQKGASSLVLRTELEGVELALPAPFGKTAGERRHLEASLALGRDLGYGELRYSNVLRASYRIGEQPVRAAVWLGGPRTPDLPERDIVVAGQLQEADLAAWLDALQRLKARLPRSAGLPEGGLVLDGLVIRELDVFGQHLQRVRLDAGVVERRWQVDVEHPHIAGSIRLPVGDGAYEFDLARLQLPFGDAPPVTRGGPVSALSAMRPSSLPRARVAIEKLVLGERDLGRWRLRMAPTERGLQVSGLTTTVAGTTFGGIDSAEGADVLWSRGADGRHKTELLVMMRARNVDDLFSHLGYETGIISTAGEAIADLYWDGPPDAFGLQALKGDIYVRLRSGQLMQTSGTAAEALKVLGILNVNHLARRLRLDFSDVFKTGFGYDTIQGILLFDRGKLTMEEPLVVDGVSSSLKMTGSFDLLGGEIDSELVVGLPLTSNLPWVVALAVPGGVPIAAGVFVAGKVFEKQLLRLTSAVYRVRGTLEKPRVEFKQMTDARRSD